MGQSSGHCTSATTTITRVPLPATPRPPPPPPPSSHAHPLTLTFGRQGCQRREGKLSEFIMAATSKAAATVKESPLAAHSTENGAWGRPSSAASRNFERCVKRPPLLSSSTLAGTRADGGGINGEVLACESLWAQQGAC